MLICWTYQCNEAMTVFIVCVNNWLWLRHLAEELFWTQSRKNYLEVCLRVNDTVWQPFLSIEGLDFDFASLFLFYNCETFSLYPVVGHTQQRGMGKVWEDVSDGSNNLFVTLSKVPILKNRVQSSPNHHCQAAYTVMKNLTLNYSL